MNTSPKPPLLADLEAACQAAAVAGMSVVRPYQTGTTGWGEAEEKTADETLVTVVDRRSEAAINQVLHERLPEIPVLGEEGGLSGFDGRLEAYTGRYLAMVDPLDGTAAFTAGASTSTVMVGVYDRELMQVVVSAVGMPALGLLWYSQDGACRQQAYDVAGWEPAGEPRECHVWAGEGGRKSRYFLDMSHGFKRKDLDTGEYYAVSTDAQMAKLIGELIGRGKLQMYGSNGVHQALVANGGEAVAGSIGTAGGPWDFLGALLVSNAGGKLAGFTADHTDSKLLTQVSDPLDAFNCDFLVTAHNETALENLIQCLRTSKTL